MSPEQKIVLHTKVTAQLDGKRLDLALKTLFPEYSRSLCQHWIEQGWVRVNGLVASSNRFKVKAGDEISVEGWQEVQLEDQGEELPLSVVYEDPELIVINKPIGLVVHPGAGNRHNTLMNGLLYHFPELAQLPRAGLVHRIDKDTSGLLVIARKLTSYNFLVQAMQQRRISREYLALVQGVPISGGVIDRPIGRHPVYRTLMAVREGGRAAITHFWVEQRFAKHALLRVKLDTGRTHQIRVHLSYLGYPMVGDKQYNHLGVPRVGLTEVQRALLVNFNHQALHAAHLTLPHPVSGDLLNFHTAPPQDFQELIAALASY